VNVPTVATFSDSTMHQPGGTCSMERPLANALERHVDDGSWCFEQATTRDWSMSHRIGTGALDYQAGSKLQLLYVEVPFKTHRPTERNYLIPVIVM